MDQLNLPNIILEKKYTKKPIKNFRKKIDNHDNKSKISNFIYKI